MSAATATIIMVASFLIYIVLRYYYWIAADVYLVLLFIFGFVVSEKEFSLFYLVGLLAAIVFDLAAAGFQISPAKSFALGGYQLSGVGFVLFQLGIGVMLYAIISVISVAKGGNIIGAPELAVSTSDIAQNLRPTFVSHLGIIENRIAFVTFEVLNVVGFLIPFVGFLFEAIPYFFPVALASIAMGIFHVAAYSVAFSLLLWATMAFALFIISYVVTKDTLGADTAHAINNGLIDLHRGLAIVT